MNLQTAALSCYQIALLKYLHLQIISVMLRLEANMIKRGTFAILKVVDSKLTEKILPVKAYWLTVCHQRLSGAVNSSAEQCLCMLHFAAFTFYHQSFNAC